MLLVQIAGATDKPAISPNSQTTTVAQEWGKPNEKDRQSVIEHTMRPYKGESHPGVANSNRQCGYQGWLALQLTAAIADGLIGVGGMDSNRAVALSTFGLMSRQRSAIFARAVRGHRRVENEPHWTMSVESYESNSR
jgi:hypothetical protein